MPAAVQALTIAACLQKTSITKGGFASDRRRLGSRAGGEESLGAPQLGDFSHLVQLDCG